MIDLHGRAALVTGGSRGIGAATCVLLARAGCDVAVHYAQREVDARAVKQAVEAAGRNACLVQADLRDAQAASALPARAAAGLGRLDILVNNAGIVQDTLLLSMTIQDWTSVHATNLTGAFLCTRHAVEMMLRQGGGRIVNIASASADVGGRGQTNYAAAKGGLVAFSRAGAVELARKGIRINAVLPGIIETDMSLQVRQRASAKLLERIPARRFGRVEEVADLVTFLVSDASDYIVGQAIAVDGGLSAS
jgi:3-oxoacyl-[acyl-carrier protein] reductase